MKIGARVIYRGQNGKRHLALVINDPPENEEAPPLDLSVFEFNGQPLWPMMEVQFATRDVPGTWTWR